MITPSANRPARRRSHRVAAAVTAVTAGVALTGAPAVVGVAGAATPHTTAGATHRVLSTDIHVTQNRSNRVELQYFTAHNRYRLISQYGSSQKLDYRSWQKDALGGGRERAVDQVVILPDRKTWSEQKGTVAPLPAAGFGIQSTGAQVAQAIRAGVAHPDGVGMKDGQRVRLLTLSTSKGERSAALWVNPSTLQPVAATSAYEAQGGSSLRIVSSHWENVSSSSLNQLTAEPKVPAGFRITHS